MYVTNSQLSIILDCSLSMVYRVFNSKNKLDLDYMVKLYDNKNSCHFYKKRFSNRLLVDFRNLEYLNANDVKHILNISYYKLQKLRQEKKIDYVQTSPTRYLYSSNSIDKLLYKKNYKVFRAKKEFFTVQEAFEIIKEKEMKISKKTLYRYIENGIIPSIYFGKTYRIPILEFNEYIKKNNKNRET